MERDGFIIIKRFIITLIFLEVRMYLDPGSGSVLLQVILAAIMGIGVAVGAFWGKIKGIFQKKSEKKEDTASDK